MRSMQGTISHNYYQESLICILQVSLIGISNLKISYSMIILMLRLQTSDLLSFSLAQIKTGNYTHNKEHEATWLLKLSSVRLTMVVALIYLLLELFFSHSSLDTAHSILLMKVMSFIINSLQSLKYTGSTLLSKEEKTFFLTSLRTYLRN